MKKIIILLLLPYYVFAQDTIITTKGEVILCTIISIVPAYITYSDTGGIYTIPTELIFDKKINGLPLFTISRM